MKDIDLDKTIEEITGVKMPRYQVVYVGLLECESILRICVQTNCETPNGLNTDEVIENYMEHNYPTDTYEILDDRIEQVVLNENDIWGLPTEF